MKLGSFMFGMAIAMHPIAYREPRGGPHDPPPDPPRWGGLRPPPQPPPFKLGLGCAPPPQTPPCDAQLKDNRAVCEKSLGLGVVISIM